jgi:hypothetical protein
VVIRLVERHEAAAPVQRTTPEVLSRYTSIDYSDLGDVEHNPEHRRWINKALAAPGHASHYHAH